GAAALSVRTRAGDVALAGVRGPRIDVRTTAGAVWASDASAPWIRLATQAGSLTLQRAQARRIALDTGAGSIAGSELTADTVSAETGARRIVLEGVGANDVTLSTGKGDVRLVLTRGPARLDVDAGGDVAVETEAGAPRPQQRGAWRYRSRLRAVRRSVGRAGGSDPRRSGSRATGRGTPYTRRRRTRSSAQSPSRIPGGLSRTDSRHEHKVWRRRPSRTCTP